MLLKSLISENNIKFGTSGMRGKVSDWTNEVIYFSVVSFLKSHLSTYPNISFKRVAIAGDLRPSTDHFLEVVSTAIKDLGYEVDYCGKISTPALMLYSVKNSIPSIMVTGSHIPDDRNGLKFHKYDGEILKSDEEIILNEEIDTSKEVVLSIKLADIKVNPIPEKEYVERYIDFFGKNSLKGLNIGLYGHSAVGRDIVYAIFTSLGAKVTKLGYSDKFIPVDTEAIREVDIKLAKEWANEYKFDSIISTDGDSDRPLISDEKGNWIRGDVLGVIVSKYLGMEAVVTPISSNSSVELVDFKKVVRTKIGSPYVIDSLKLLTTEGLKSSGYEANGGYLLATDLSDNGNILSKLVSRDSVLPMLSLIAYSKTLSLPISKVVSKFEKRFTSSRKVDNFPTENSKEIINKFYINDKINNSKVKDFFKSILDFDITDINTLDGVRVTYKNGDVLHIRPSGNAPELRCYSESDSQEKADRLASELKSLFN
jgi:phosphomannomutase